MNENGSPSDIATMLIDATDRLFREQCTRATLESAEQGAWPSALWARLEEIGLTLAAREEGRGGVGATPIDLAQICRLAGAYSLPCPLVETMLAEKMLSAAGLPSIDGPLSVGPVVRKDGLKLASENGGWRVSGRLRRVPWGRDVGGIVAIATDETGAKRTIVIRKPAVSSQGKNYAFEPRDNFDFSGLSVAAGDVGEANLGWSEEELMLHGALYRSLQMAGALERALADTVQYAKDRVQFGKPIGKFQAVQQQMAVMATHVASALAAALSAAAMLTPLEIAMAKTRSSEAAGVGSAVAHQVLAAIGFTHEHMLHFSTRRLWSWRDEFGSDSDWAAWIGAYVVTNTTGEELWSFLTKNDALVSVESTAPERQ